MARSQLLQDIVNGEKSIESILLRLKVILSDLNNDLLMKWINGELEGYKNEEDVPKYRILTGNPVGNFIVNFYTKYTNTSVPLEALLPPEDIEKIITLKHIDSIAIIQNLLSGDNRENFAVTISTTYCHSISKNTLQITSMDVKFSSIQFDSIVSSVRNKLVEIVMELEKQFENLDELDIRPQVEDSSSKKEKVIYNLGQIIFEESINIGDGNKISQSKIGKLFRGNN